MPILKNRPTKGVGKSAQMRTSGGQQGNGVQSFDGRTNTNAGSTSSPVPKTLNGKAVVVRTDDA